MRNHPKIPDDIPTVNAVEFAAEMTKSWRSQTDRLVANWKKQTDRLVLVIGIATLIGVGVVSSINWGVQYRLSRSRQILDSTRAAVSQNRDMIDSLREDRITSELRFRTLMAAVKSVELAVDQRKAKR